MRLGLENSIFLNHLSTDSTLAFFLKGLLLPQFVENMPRSASVPFLSFASPLPARRRSTLRQRFPISPVFRGISPTNKFELEEGASRHEMEELLSSSLSCPVPRRRSAKSMVNWLVHDASPETSSGSSEVHPGSSAMQSYLEEATTPGSTLSGLRATGSSLTGSYRHKIISSTRSSINKIRILGEIACNTARS